MVVFNSVTKTALITPVVTIGIDGTLTTSYITKFLESDFFYPASIPFTTSINADGTTRTAVVSSVAITGIDGKPITSLTTSYINFASSLTASKVVAYTSTITTYGIVITVVVSPTVVTETHGKVVTCITTIVLGDNSISSNNLPTDSDSVSSKTDNSMFIRYTTKITGPYDTQIAIVSQGTTTDEYGHTLVYLTKFLVDVAKHQESPYTTVITLLSTAHTLVISPVTTSDNEKNQTVVGKTSTLGDSKRTTDVSSTSEASLLATTITTNESIKTAIALEMLRIGPDEKLTRR